MPVISFPPVRKLAAALQASRTTIESAYNQLVADGYLLNEPKRGYFAAALAGLRSRSDAPVTQSIEPPAVRYNFANNYIDPASFPTDLWRRYLNRALKNKALLSGYGEPQGETELRRTLAKYSSVARGVVCSPEQIVIGAGVQSLLQILIDILQPELTEIALEAPGLCPGRTTFHLPMAGRCTISAPSSWTPSCRACFMSAPPILIRGAPCRPSSG